MILPEKTDVRNSADGFQRKNRRFFGKSFKKVLTKLFLYSILIEPCEKLAAFTFRGVAQLVARQFRVSITTLGV